MAMITSTDLRMPKAGAPAAPIAPRAPAAYSRKNPFLAELTRHDRLTGPGSLKDTRHFVLSLEGSGLSYTPGDSLGAFGRHSPELVDELIGLLGFDPDAAVQDPKGQATTLREALLRDYTVNRANRKIMAGLAERIPQGEQRNRLMELVDNSDALCEYIDSRDYVDILREFNEARFESPAVFLSQLSPVVPRLYSIASSFQAHPGEVHLCITVVRYETHGRPKKGLASGFFADHSDMFVKNIPVYVQESRTFRLPKDPATDIIMCGPGVGLAPFRAFLEQRALEGATGRNWLFFGEQHRATDFLYGERTPGVSAERQPAPARPGLLPRPIPQGLRAAPHAGAGQGALVLAAEWRLLLRVRRRAPHGQGRAPDAD